MPLLPPGSPPPSEGRVSTRYLLRSNICNIFAIQWQQLVNITNSFLRRIPHPVRVFFLRPALSEGRNETTTTTSFSSGGDTAASLLLLLLPSRVLEEGGREASFVRSVPSSSSSSVAVSPLLTGHRRRDRGGEVESSRASSVVRPLARQSCSAGRRGGEEEEGRTYFGWRFRRGRTGGGGTEATISLSLLPWPLFFSSPLFCWMIPGSLAGRNEGEEK